MSNLIKFKYRGNFSEFMALYREKAHKAGLSETVIEQACKDFEARYLPLFEQGLSLGYPALLFNLKMAGLDDEWINGIFKTIKDISDEVSVYFRELIHQFALQLFDLHIQTALLMDSMDIRDVH